MEKIMKALEKLFKKIGELPEYGIAYNLKGLSEVRYWDSNGKEIHIGEAPEDLESGIFFFESQDGKIVLLDRSI